MQVIIENLRRPLLQTLDTKSIRTYGYDILINTFETMLRSYLVENLPVIHGNDWRNCIPLGVTEQLRKQGVVPEGLSIECFFDEATFLNLKDIIISSSNSKLIKPFFGDIDNERFIELFDNLNIQRRRIAHAKSSFGLIELDNLTNTLKALCRGSLSKSIIQYIDSQAYTNAKAIPAGFFKESFIINNLPNESYKLDGGFVGREKEIKAIKAFVNSQQDRVITITGAGGVGKTAIALKIAYSFLSDTEPAFNSIVWFSAKTTKLTERGIIAVDSEIKSYEQLVKDILEIIDPRVVKKLKRAKASTKQYANYLDDSLKTKRNLIIIDNLETIIKNEALIKFIEEIPRPSQILITSRKGLGEFERRYPITDMLEKDAITLFRIMARERNRSDLLQLSNQTISELVKRVRCYPLLIKWSIGQVCLGRGIDQAFSQILAGESEIAKFVFNDVFALLNEQSKTILYSMIIYGDKPASKYILMHLADVDEGEFEDSIRELVMTSFVFSQNREEQARIVTDYTMLELTRGFVGTKLDEDEKTRQVLLTRHYHLAEQIQDFERSKSNYDQSLFSLGIKTTDEQIAFNHVKAAKRFIEQHDFENAQNNFDLAIKIAPTLSYVLTEYSKFNYRRGHLPEALRMAEHAVDVNPESWHAWFNYGITLRRMRKLEEAISIFDKAKLLNPKHLPIYTELGMIYSSLGQFEMATTEYTTALHEEKNPNYRHQVITLTQMAYNYRNWARSFETRDDHSGQIEMLNKGIEALLKAEEITPDDSGLCETHLRLLIDLGIAKTKLSGFETGKPYFMQCLEPNLINQKVELNEINKNIHNDAVAWACYYLAYYSMEEKLNDPDKIEKWIDQGIAISLNPDLHKKLFILRKRITGDLEDPNRLEGIIRFYDSQKKFGVIEHGTATYIFFRNDLPRDLSFETLRSLRNIAVSFRPVPDRKKPGNMIASRLKIKKTIISAKPNGNKGTPSI